MTTDTPAANVTATYEKNPDVDGSWWATITGPYGPLFIRIERNTTPWTAGYGMWSARRGSRRGGWVVTERTRAAAAVAAYKRRYIHHYAN